MNGPLSRLRALLASQSPATEADGVMSEAMAETDGPTWYHDMTGQEQADHQAEVERQYQEQAAASEVGTEEEGDAHLEKLDRERGTYGETERERLDRETEEYWDESIPAPAGAAHEEANEREAAFDTHENEQDLATVAREADEDAEAEAWREYEIPTDEAEDVCVAE
jgi:hypothetical protein